MPVRGQGWIAMLLALSVSTVGAAERCRLVSSPPIPVTIIGSRPTIPAELDGHKTRLLVDTGAFFDALSPAEARQFNLPLSPGPHGLYVVGGLGNVYPKIATVKSLRLGPVSFPGNARFLVLANDLGSGISGVLGQNIYRILDVEFDFANGAMRFFKVSNCGQQPLAYWANASGQSVSVLDLVMRDRYSTQLFTTVAVNGHSVNAIVDTGAPVSQLSLAAAKVVGAAPGSPGVTAVEGTSGKYWNAPIDEVDLGDSEKIEHTHILVADENFAFGPGVWMFIGADFFLSHRVYLATSQSKLYFTYNGGPVFDLNSAHAAQDRAGPTPGVGLPASSTASSTADSTAGADDLLRQGLALAYRLQFPQALADLTQACRLAPENADCRYQRGIVYWRDDQPDQAMADFTAAIQLDPGNFRARLWRAEVQLVAQAGRKPDPQSTDDPRIASSSVDRLASTDAKPSQPTSAGPLDPKVIGDAEADLDAVDRLAPAEADLRLTLGRVYEDVGRYALAVHQYDLWINYHPEDYRLPMALTWRCGTLGQGNTNLDQALRDCNKAYGLMGISFWSSRGKWPPSWAASLLTARSVIELRQGNLTGTVDDDNAAIKLEPEDAYALYARGLAELRQGAKTRSESDFAAALRLQPGMDRRYASMSLTP